MLASKVADLTCLRQVRITRWRLAPFEWVQMCFCVGAVAIFGHGFLMYMIDCR